jgi:hypothetical protein
MNRFTFFSVTKILSNVLISRFTQCVEESIGGHAKQADSSEDEGLPVQATLGSTRLDYRVDVLEAKRAGSLRRMELSSQART